MRARSAIVCFGPIFTRDDQKILADFAVKALASKAVQEMEAISARCR
jgi:hypothetical protein